MEIFEQVPFFDTVLSAIRIRSGMDVNTLKSHIAYTAGQKKSSMTMTGAQTIIDILRVSGCLSEDDGRLTVISPADRPAESGPSFTKPPEIAVSTSGPVSSGRHLPPVTIQIQIQVKPDDLEELGGKIRTLLDDLSADSESD